jgi:hypothetical protein
VFFVLASDIFPNHAQALRLAASELCLLGCTLDWHNYGHIVASRDDGQLGCDYAV